MIRAHDPRITFYNNNNNNNNNNYYCLDLLLLLFFVLASNTERQTIWVIKLRKRTHSSKKDYMEEIEERNPRKEVG